MNDMAGAFVAAGFRSASDRLRELALAAIAKYPGAKMRSAQRQFIVDQLRIEMTYALIERYNGAGVLSQSIGTLLNETDASIRAQRPRDAETSAAGTTPQTTPKLTSSPHPSRDAPKGAGRGQVDRDTQNDIAAANSSPNTGKPVGGGRVDLDTQTCHAPANPSRDDARPQGERRSEPASVASSTKSRTRAAPNLEELAAKQRARTLATVETMKRLSRLDTFIINGQKIGDVTPREAKAWAGSRERDARFVRLLTAGLPENQPIRKFRCDEDADALYEQAEAEYAA